MSDATQVEQKELTMAQIQKDLKGKKHSIGEYLGQLVLVAITAGIISLGAAGAVIFYFAIAINVLRMILHDLKHRKPSFYILERACLEKKQVEQDEGPDEWQLWFSNADGSLWVAIRVEKEFYDQTQVGEEFYVVFLQQGKYPSLVYRKSQWLLRAEDFSPVKPSGS